MLGHFGIRVTDADKDKLVGELDVDNRHLNNSGHVRFVGYGPGSGELLTGDTQIAGSDQDARFCSSTIISAR
jgi:hypothetical protein